MDWACLPHFYFSKFLGKKTKETMSIWLTMLGLPVFPTQAGRSPSLLTPSTAHLEYDTLQLFDYQADNLF
jgi:hypothetical protein